MSYISFQDVHKVYQMGEVTIDAVDGVTFDIEKGEFAIIVGPSGAGKTTVLNMLGGMDACTSGAITVDGARVSDYNARQLTTYRRHDIGFVFQFYNLVQNLTALENVELAAQICEDPMDAASVLEHVGLGHRLDNFPAQLSGGEQQRVAIARALANNPKLLQDTCRQHGMTVVVITHNTALTPMADRVIHIKNGKVERMERNDAPTPVEEIEW